MHDQPADFAFEFGQHAGVIRRGGFAGFGDDLFGCGDGFLGFLFLDPGGGGAGFLDEFGRLGVGLDEDLLTLGLGAGQFGLDFLGVGQALGDPLRGALPAWSAPVCRRRNRAGPPRC